jgi:hypothetical protein
VQRHCIPYVAYSYSALAAGRQPKAISVVSGTGLMPTTHQGIPLRRTGSVQSLKLSENPAARAAARAL